ncbi:MAG TPA: DUF4337 domain-containing protein [Rhizomicrobium sp.]|jgi:hypothetical protein|nr:DUF4337 domain-containing protein [Rhizomicrobium sp.]
MSAEEEVEEHVHHAHEPFDKRVAGSMAIIAAMLAVVSVLGQHFNTEKLLVQQEASDQWAYYQAKDIRHYAAQLAGDILMQMKADTSVAKKYTQDSTRYKEQGAAIQDKAHEFEHERDKIGHEADSFHLGEVFLEVAIVLSSLSILTKRGYLFGIALAAAATGVVISAGGWYWYGVLGKL